MPGLGGGEEDKHLLLRRYVRRGCFGGAPRWEGREAKAAVKQTEKVGGHDGAECEDEKLGIAVAGNVGS